MKIQTFISIQNIIQSQLETSQHLHSAFKHSSQPQNHSHQHTILTIKLRQPKSTNNHKYLNPMKVVFRQNPKISTDLSKNFISCKTTIRQEITLILKHLLIFLKVILQVILTFTADPILFHTRILRRTIWEGHL